MGIRPKPGCLESAVEQEQINIIYNISGKNRCQEPSGKVPKSVSENKAKSQSWREHETQKVKRNLLCRISLESDY